MTLFTLIAVFTASLLSLDIIGSISGIELPIFVIMFQIRIVLTGLIGSTSSFDGCEQLSIVSLVALKLRFYKLLKVLIKTNVY